MDLATGGFGDAFNAALVAYIKIERDCLAADRFNFRNERRHTFTASTGGDDIRRECASKVLAKAAAGSGHERYLSG
jgi:hypothetical protein